MSKEWFILQFKSNSHHLAAKNLNRQGFETFLPLHETTSRRLSRFINTSKPLFPGYMFIRFDKAESEWNKINNTYGVSRLITFNSILKPIPTKFVDSLMKRYDSSGKLIPIEKLKNGEPSIPSTLLKEKKMNIFLRTDDLDVKNILNC